MKKTLIILLYVLFLVLVAEIWARAYYSINRNVNFFSSLDDQKYTWYPELRDLADYEYDPTQYNILLLGGSVLTKEWGKIPEQLFNKVTEVTGKRANIVNLACPAHSSLDSYYKYKETIDKSFDLVLFYQAINETRANNVPPELWKDDYSHYAWYEEINWYYNHPKLKKCFFLLPYFLKHIQVQFKREVLARDQTVPSHTPRKEWLKYGKDIKSRQAYENNVRKIIEISLSKKENLVLMSYAYCLPEYLPDELETVLKFSDVFGEINNVILGIEVHNGVLRKLAREYNVLFLDQWEILKNQGAFFSDICHLSSDGSKLFIDNISGFFLNDYSPEGEQVK